MVETWTVSDDGLEWTFTLRDGLKWHDGAPVRAEDCVASLERWGKRDGMGQQLLAAMETIEAVDDTNIPFKLKYPFGIVIESLAKLTSNVPFRSEERRVWQGCVSTCRSRWSRYT